MISIICLFFFTTTGGGGEGNSLLMSISFDEDEGEDVEGVEFSFELIEDGETAGTFVSINLFTTSWLSMRILSRLDCMKVGRYTTIPTIMQTSATIVKMIPNTKLIRKPIVLVLFVCFFCFVFFSLYYKKIFLSLFFFLSLPFSLCKIKKVYLPFLLIIKKTSFFEFKYQIK